jgi:hypothetical protein
MEIKFPPGFNTSKYVQDHDVLTPKIKVRIAREYLPFSILNILLAEERLERGQHDCVL